MATTITFAALRTKLVSEIWPSGAPENNTNSINGYFLNSVLELQKRVECLKRQNISVFEACSTFFNCWLTWIDHPGKDAEIQRVWTVANGGFCNKVYYRRRSHNEVLNWQKDLGRMNTIPTLNLPSLSLGTRYPDKNTDSTFGRSRNGIYSIDRQRIYLAPWIQSNETIYVEWDGVKTDWADTDLFYTSRWTQAEEELIKLFILWKYELFHGDKQEARVFQQSYDDGLADLINDCNRELYVNTDRGGPETDGATSEELLAEEVDATESTADVLAFIANYGGTDQGVAALIDSWSPTAVVTAGGNLIPGSPDDEDMDLAIGGLFRQYIFPYEGDLGAGAPTNKFWPALGKVDLDTDQFLYYLDYFALPNNERYYDVVIGNVHIFVVNQGINSANNLVEPDGNTYNSVQAQWIQAKLALSTVKWKVVVIGRPPYSSGSTSGSATELRWDFKAWGADVVVSGGETNYERVTVSGFNYLNIGIGGKALTGFGSPISGSQVRNSSVFGALKMDATCESLSLSAIDVNGNVIDSVSL